MNVAVLVSGGLDSFVAYHLACKEHGSGNVVPIFVGFGQKYESAEQASVRRLIPQARFIALAGWLENLHGQVKDDVIPARNALLASLAAGFGDEVWLSAVHGEEAGRNGDKSPSFYGSMTATLTESCRYLRRFTVVRSPFLDRRMTKAEVVAMGLGSLNLGHARLFETTTCYHALRPGLKCGLCKVCYRRWEAFALNGLDEPGYEALPWLSPYAKEWDQRVKVAATTGDLWDVPEKRREEHWRTLDIIAAKEV